MNIFLSITCTVLVVTCFLSVNASAERSLEECLSVGDPTIGAEGCPDEHSCFCSTATIGVAGCTGANACQFTGGLVGANSCVGLNACQHADASIGAASCLGENACIDTSALIGAASCLGGSPCTLATGTIGAASCKGSDACRKTGPDASIGAGSCFGEGRNCACLNSLVGALSCLGEDVCIGTIGSIAAGSCTEKGACYRADGVISAGACTGEGSCWGTNSDFVSGAGSCTGKNSCRCATGTYAAGSCTTEDSCSTEDCPIDADDSVIFCPVEDTTLAPSNSPTTSTPTGTPTRTPTKSPVASRIESPVASPTGGAYGDPHFKTWSGELYDYHGICDLVLLRNPMFLKGLGLDIFVRAKKTLQWSFISTAVVRIGQETFEVSGRMDGDSYWMNKKEGDASQWDNTHHTISGLPIHYSKLNPEQQEYIIDVSSEETHTLTSITMKTYKSFVRVDLKNPSKENFGNSLGLMGSYPEGKRVGRDGKTILKDWSKFGQDWQVRNSDPMLFRKADGPQHPEKCDVPTNTVMRRRLASSTISRDDAELACSRVLEEERDLCIFDVMATNDFGTVGAY